MSGTERTPPASKPSQARNYSPGYIDRPYRKCLFLSVGRKHQANSTSCPEVHDHRVLARLKYSAPCYPAAECFSFRKAWYHEGYKTACTLLEAQERSIAI